MHPALPISVDVTIEASGCDGSHFALKSPLCGKIGEKAPAPYWTVLHIEEPEEANMEEQQATVSFPTPAVVLKSAKATPKASSGSKRKVPMLTVTMPVLVNKAKINTGEVLTIHRPTTIDGAAPEGTT